MIKRGQGSFFLQEESDEAFSFIICVGVGGLTVPRGGRTIKYCPDPRRAGLFRPSGFVTGEAGEVTMSLRRPLDAVMNYLMELDCPFQARINWACRGDRSVMANYQIAAWVYQAQLGDGSIDTPVAMEPGDDDRVETATDVGGLLFSFVYPLTGVAQANEFANNINDIAFAPSECESDCGDRIGDGELGVIVMDTDVYLYPDETEVAYTVDGGTTWTAAAGEPFGAAFSEDLTAVLLMVTGDGYRTLVARAALLGLDPQVAYSDDDGATWTQVYVDTPFHNVGIWDLEQDVAGRVWACGDDGYIWRSANQGQAWTLIENSIETDEDLVAIASHPDNERVVYAVGDNNAFLRTTDGADFALVVGPAVGIDLLTVDVNIFGHVFVGTADARLFRSVDGGDNWVEIMDLTAGSIDRVMFDAKFNYFGFAIHNNATPDGVVYRSEDGGTTWVTGANSSIGATPANDGLYALWANGPNMAYVAGNIDPTYAHISKFTRRA